MKLNIWFIPIVFLSACHFRSDQQYLAKISRLPAFQIISIDSCHFIDTKSLQSGAPMIFLYFDPDCEHCQKETKTIISHKEYLQGVRIFLVTNADEMSVKTFCKELRPDTVANVMVGKDYQYSFYRSFLPSTVPFMAIYNKRKKLAKLYIGETNINSVIEATKEL